MSTDGRTWRAWARDEFLWPGKLLSVGGSAWALWYGNAHRTWEGGFCFAVGMMVLTRAIDQAGDSWRAFRRELRRG